MWRLFCLRACGHAPFIIKLMEPTFVVTYCDSSTQTLGPDIAEEVLVAARHFGELLADVRRLQTEHQALLEDIFHVRPPLLGTLRSDMSELSWVLQQAFREQVATLRADFANVVDTMNARQQQQPPLPPIHRAGHWRHGPQHP
jgi:hypothetical protein